MDTSVWIDYWRGRTKAGRLGELLEDDAVLLHPWILGELVLGGLGRRAASITADLRTLPAAPVVAERDVLELIGHHSLSGSGIGWVDAQLLASARLGGADLWTHDAGLAGVWTAINRAR